MLAEIDVGRLVAGKYELVRLIGKGAMGEVWLATHNSLGGEFAIKLVQPSEDEEDESAAGRFQLEAQISAKLSRKTRHIVSVSDHGEEEGLAYLVMELLEGESLEARIKRAGEMDLAECVAIVMQVGRALGQAHAEGIFHRDLKPANIFLTKDEDGRMLVKLLDFGIARTQKPFRTRSPFATGKDMVLGTPSYMSPEQARGLDTLDHRCDLWALSVVAYEALTRRIPWEGETVEDIFLSICTHRMVPILTRRGDLPVVIEGLFARSFTPKLAERFGTAAELSEAFEALVDPLAVEAAIGTPLRSAASSRRLLAATPAEFAVANPNAAHGAPAAAPSDRRGSSPNLGGGLGGGEAFDGLSDPVGMAVGDATLFSKKKKSSGWLVALIAALATIGIVVLALMAFKSRGDDKTTTKSPPTDTTTVAPTSDRPAIPPPVDPTTAAPPPVTPPPSTAKTGRPPVALVKTGQAAAPPAPPPPAPPAPPPVTAHAPPAPPTPPPAPASAATRKPGDKSDVF